MQALPTAEELSRRPCLLFTTAKAPAVLRLSFHDAAPHDSVEKTGGANASILFEASWREKAEMLSVTA